MEKISLEDRIYLEPKFLNENYSKHIYDKIIEKYTNYCTEEYGYILKIYKNIEILENFLSEVNTGAYFKVKFKVKILKPKIGDEIVGEICFIHGSGLVAKINEKLKIAISDKNMGKYKYDKGFFRKKSETINIGDKIKAVISSIKYEKRTFHLLGIFSELVKEEEEESKEN